MSGVTIALLVLILVAGATRAWATYQTKMHRTFRLLPVPEAKPHWFFGHTDIFLQMNTGDIFARWFEKANSNVLVWQSFLWCTPRIAISDMTALTAILVTNAYEFNKPDAVQSELELIFGKGLFTAKDDVHKRQRKILNSAFAPAVINNYDKIFVSLANQLISNWTDGLKDKDEAIIDLIPSFGNLTFDVIGQAGFNTDFKLLKGEQGQHAELAHVLRQLGQSQPGKASRMKFLCYFLLRNLVMRVPLLRFLPTERLRTMRDNCQKLVKHSHMIILQRQADLNLIAEEKSSRDLITTMLTHLKTPEATQQNLSMSPEEIEGQCTSFLLAGSETTATSLSWACAFLAQKQTMQQKLRDELTSIDHTDSSLVASLPYLDGVVKEVLRLRPPVPNTLRQAKSDSTVPLGKPITLRDGRIVTSIDIPAGTIISIPLRIINTSEEYFGPDAEKFNPSRWIDNEALKKSTCGTYAGMMTFLGGPRNCIGWRFAVLELKLVLAQLILAFEFSTPDGIEYVTKQEIVARTFVVGRELEGPQMPIRVRKLTV